VPHPHSVPKEPSAFGFYNISSGPFFDPDHVEKKPAQNPRKPMSMRDLEEFGDGSEFVLPLPDDLGKQGRKKEKERLAKAARDMQADEEEDWFNGPGTRGGAGLSKSTNGKSAGGSSGRGGGGGGGKGPPSGLKKMSFGNIGGSGDSSRFSRASESASDRRDRRAFGDDFLPRPSRETDSIQIKGASKRHTEERRSGSRNNDDKPSSSARRYNDDRWDGRREYDRYEESYHDYSSRRRDYSNSTNAPKYKGGYRR